MTRSPIGPNSSGKAKEDSTLGFLLWINVLSLDAPLVAVMWQVFLARIHHRPLAGIHIFLLATSTWLAYSGDRILDGIRTRSATALAPRHEFGIRYRPTLIPLWGLIFILSLSAGWGFLESQLFWRGLTFAFGVGIYCGMTFYNPNLFRRLLPREMVVALLFVAGTAFFVFDSKDARSLECWIGWVGFGILCFINCTLISVWEREIDQIRGEVSAASTLPRISHRANAILILVFLATVLTGILSPWRSAQLVLLAVGLSLIGLTALNRSKMSLELKPVLADLALLSPLILLFWI